MNLAELVDGPAPGRRCWRAVVAGPVPERGERSSRVDGPRAAPEGGWGVALVTPRNERRRTGEPVAPAGGWAVNQFCETH